MQASRPQLHSRALGTPSCPQALGIGMAALPARWRSTSPGRIRAQRLVPDDGSRVSWVDLDTAVAEAAGHLVAPPCPSTSQAQRQWMRRERVGVQRSPSTGGWQRRYSLEGRGGEHEEGQRGHHGRLLPLLQVIHAQKNTEW